jgi:hypothetical protein
LAVQSSAGSATLAACRPSERDSRAAEKRDEFAPFHVPPENRPCEDLKPSTLRSAGEGETFPTAHGRHHNGGIVTLSIVAAQLLQHFSPICATFCQYDEAGLSFPKMSSQGEIHDSPIRSRDSNLGTLANRNCSLDERMIKEQIVEFLKLLEGPGPP